jgi:hypothetical protein
VKDTQLIVLLVCECDNVSHLADALTLLCTIAELLPNGQMAHTITTTIHEPTSPIASPVIHFPCFAVLRRIAELSKKTLHYFD